MSQRLGMADGRCFTINSSAQLLNNFVMKQNNISFEDNYSYRQLLQKQGPQLMSKMQEQQGKADCNNCNVPMLKMPDIYQVSEITEKTLKPSYRMSTCAICLNEVKSTRTNPPIRCGHVFHSHCLQRWKEQGKNTCPTCRKVFDASQFKIVVTIQNNYTAAANSVSLNEESIFDVLDLFDITFDVENQPDLDSILADLGVSLSDFDPTVLDAE